VIVVDARLRVDRAGAAEDEVDHPAWSGLPNAEDGRQALRILAGI
jgi:hypothetical protein